MASPGRINPDARTRDVAQRLLQEDHVLVLPCGERSIRFRPSPDVTEPELEFGLILSTNPTNQARLGEVVADVAVPAR